MSKFTVNWQAYDGYAGGSRPQSFDIREDDLDDDMTDAALRELFEELLDEAFHNRVSACADNEDEFIAWAKERIAERNK